MIYFKKSKVWLLIIQRIFFLQMDNLQASHTIMNKRVRIWFLQGNTSCKRKIEWKRSPNLSLSKTKSFEIYFQHTIHVRIQEHTFYSEKLWKVFYVFYKRCDLYCFASNLNGKNVMEISFEPSEDNNFSTINQCFYCCFQEKIL